jgi:hypothetical protein
MPKKTPRDSPQGESGKLCFRLATDLRSLGPNARLWNTWFVYTCEYPIPLGPHLAASGSVQKTTFLHDR